MDAGPVSSPDDNESIQSRLDDVQRRLSEHPGYREYLACEELRRTINAVFVLNLRTLLAVLIRPTQDQALAAELFQNMRRGDIREGYEAAVTNTLHNYVAGSATLVDHTRRVMDGRTGPIAEEFELRKKRVASDHEVLFIKNLRNFVLHRVHPFLGHTVTVADQSGRITGEIELSRTDLLTWDRWSSPARAFIRDQPERIPLRPIVQHHAGLMVELHNWLHDQLALANRAALKDTNQLVDEGNAILTGLDPAAARRLSEAMTRLRNSPTPIKTEDFLAILRGEPPAPGSERSPPGGDA
jgi:hypothetical protein